IVNSILWNDQVLRDAYGADVLDKTPSMDNIRYYKGEVAFGMRKHFVPHRLEVEPEPLKPIQLSRYTDHVSRKKVSLEFDHFAEVHQYTCPFYRKDQKSFVLNFVSPDAVIEVARALPEGFYFLFAVPTDHYQKIYGAKSGPLGLVHGLILEVTSKDLWIHHASTSSKKVMRQPIDQYVAEMRIKLHQGYVIYEADPTWDYTQSSAPDQETLAIQECEKNLHGMGSRRSAGLR
ncbi:MAG: N-acetylmuramoyl-L-alanine amidase-like domain-containing protein, partial [Bdellovibrionota bacterium]